jgi:hypothetical protein
MLSNYEAVGKHVRHQHQVFELDMIVVIVQDVKKLLLRYADQRSVNSQQTNHWRIKSPDHRQFDLIGKQSKEIIFDHEDTNQTQQQNFKRAARESPLGVMDQPPHSAWGLFFCSYLMTRRYIGAGDGGGFKGSISAPCLSDQT